MPDAREVPLFSWSFKSGAGFLEPESSLLTPGRLEARASWGRMRSKQEAELLVLGLEEGSVTAFLLQTSAQYCFDTGAAVVKARLQDAGPHTEAALPGAGGRPGGRGEHLPLFFHQAPCAEGRLATGHGPQGHSFDCCGGPAQQGHQATQRVQKHNSQRRKEEILAPIPRMRIFPFNKKSPFQGQISVALSCERIAVLRGQRAAALPVCFGATCHLGHEHARVHTRLRSAGGLFP